MFSSVRFPNELNFASRINTKFNSTATSPDVYHYNEDDLMTLILHTYVCTIIYS